MVLDGIFIKTTTCTCPAKEQVELLQVQVPTTTYKYLQVLTPNGKCHFKFVFLEPLPYYKYKYLPSKAVNGNSPGSAFSPPTTLCSPPACPHLSRWWWDLCYIYMIYNILWWSLCVCDCLSRKMSTFLECHPLPRQPPTAPATPQGQLEPPVTHGPWDPKIHRFLKKVSLELGPPVRHQKFPPTQELSAVEALSETLRTQAQGAKRDIENTPKCILAPRSRQLVLFWP